MKFKKNQPVGVVLIINLLIWKRTFQSLDCPPSDRTNLVSHNNSRFIDDNPFPLCDINTHCRYNNTTVITDRCSVLDALVKTNPYGFIISLFELCAIVAVLAQLSLCRRTEEKQIHVNPPPKNYKSETNKPTEPGVLESYGKLLPLIGCEQEKYSLPIRHFRCTMLGLLSVSVKLQSHRIWWIIILLRLIVDRYAK